MHLNRELRKLLLNIKKNLKQGTIKNDLKKNRNKLHFDEAQRLNKQYALAQRLRVKRHNLMQETTRQRKMLSKQTNKPTEA